MSVVLSVLLCTLIRPLRIWNFGSSKTEKRESQISNPDLTGKMTPPFSKMTLFRQLVLFKDGIFLFKLYHMFKVNNDLSEI